MAAQSGLRRERRRCWSSYVAGSYDQKKDFELLNQEMAAVENSKANRMFYLSLPPSVFKSVTSMLKVLLILIFIKINSSCRLPACRLQDGPALLSKNHLARILQALLT